MIEIGKHTADQFVLTVDQDGNSMSILISRRDLLNHWNKIAEIIVDTEK